MKARKIYEKILAGSHNIRFADFCKVAEAFGYRLDRTRGSHHIYEHRKRLVRSIYKMTTAKPNLIRFDNSCATWKNSN